MDNTILVVIGFVFILAFIIVAEFDKKECYVHEDYELKTTKVCAGDGCTDKSTCQLYQNYLNDC